MVLPSKMGPVKGLKPGSRVESDVRDCTLAINVDVVVNRCYRQGLSSVSAVVAVVIIIGRGCCCHQPWSAVVIGCVCCSHRRSWSLPSLAVMVVAVIGRHQHQLWLSLLLAVVVGVVVIVIDAVVPAL